MQSLKHCTLSKEDGTTTSEEEEDEVGEVIKEKSALRSGATCARPVHPTQKRNG
jgi:hypothetical protein